MTRMSVPHLMNPLMLTASSVLRSLQRISRWALPSLVGSAAGTRGLSSRGAFLVLDPPGRTRARLALRRPARCVRGGGIEAVVAFQSLAIVLDLTARLEGVLGLGAGGKENAGASDGQYGAHGRIRADRVPACKTRINASAFWRPGSRACRTAH